MPVREALIIEAGGERFRLYFDLEVPEVLHITLRHGTTSEDAIRTFMEGEASQWDEARQRFESVTETHGRYWARHPHDGSVIVISCFEREEE
jgi:hypothetical protein